jgi:hypothetical protein
MLLELTTLIPNIYGLSGFGCFLHPEIDVYSLSIRAWGPYFEFGDQNRKKAACVAR